MKEELTLDKLKEVLGDIFFREKKEPKIRTKEEIEEMTSKPESGYHKILEGYCYTTLAGNVQTGHGGAKMLYKVCLETFPSEDTVQSFILVHLDNGTYPLKALNVKEL